MAKNNTKEPGIRLTKKKDDYHRKLVFAKKKSEKKLLTICGKLVLKYFQEISLSLIIRRQFFRRWPTGDQIKITFKLSTYKLIYFFQFVISFKDLNAAGPIGKAYLKACIGRFISGYSLFFFNS